MIYIMHHEPDDYLCPFCDWLAGHETKHKQASDIVLQDDYITAFVSPKWWINNPGNVIIIPNRHTENIYSIDDETLSRIAIVACAIREAYDGCIGTSTRQHNEPDGNQSTLHSHAHILPRYPEDKFYENHTHAKTTPPTERAFYATKLRDYFAARATHDSYPLDTTHGCSGHLLTLAMAIVRFSDYIVVFFTQKFSIKVVDISVSMPYDRGSFE